MPGHTSPLDDIDAQVIRAFVIDSRIPLSHAARITGLSKDVVSYRLNKLISQGVILRFIASLDYSALGLQSFRTYIRLQHTTAPIEKEIYAYLKRLRGLRVMGRMEGQYNYGWVCCARSALEYDRVLRSFLEKYGHYVQVKETNTLIEHRIYRQGIKPEAVLVAVCEQSKKKDFDATDIAILKLMHLDARMPLVELAARTGLNTRTVRERIKRMKDEGLISYFGVDTNMSLTRIDYYKVMLNLEDTTKIDMVHDFALRHPRTVGNIFRALGGADVEIDIYTSSFDHFLSVIDDLKKFLHNYIKSYSYHNISNLYFVPMTEMAADLFSPDS